MKAILDRLQLVEECLRMVAIGVPIDKELGKVAWEQLEQIKVIAEILPDHVDPDKLRQPPERIIDLPGK